MAELKGVLFDLGGTLYSYARMREINRSVLATLAQELALKHEVAELERLHRLASVEADRRYASQPFYLFSDYFRTIFDSMLREIGRSELADHFEWFEEYQRVALVTSMTLKPDCHSTLKALRDRGLYTGIVSNIDESMLRPLLSRGQLRSLFHHCTSSEAARSCKPDRQIFELALKNAGLRAEETLFIGDSLEQDIAGACAVGMRTMLISEFGDSAPMHIGASTVEPDYRVTHLSEMLPIVDQLMRVKS